MAEEDRISQLPDGILYQILYFAGTKKAVQVSILSKRWRHLWSSTPLLNFDVSDFPTRYYARLQLANYRLDNFMNKFEKTRRIKGTVLLKLRIARFGGIRNFSPDICVSPRWKCAFGILLSPGLTEVEAIFYCPKNSRRRPKIYKVRSYRPFPRSMLHAQEFHNYRYSYPQCFLLTEKFFLTENLLINRCDFSNVDIQLEGLKVLKLWHCRTFNGDIRVSAPNLVSLDCRQIHASRLKLLHDEFPLLEDAVLDIAISDSDFEVSYTVMNILPKLRNVKALTLCMPLFRRLSFVGVGHLPNFPNLKNVTVMCETSTKSIGITNDVLPLCPNLEKLEINDNKTDGKSTTTTQWIDHNSKKR